MTVNSVQKGIFCCNLHNSFDCREEEELDQRKSSSVAPRGGVPPVSPHACIRDAVADELFDDIWREVVGLLEELLHKYWEKQLPGVSELLNV